MIDKDFLACSRDNEILLVVLNWNLASIDEFKDLLADFGRLILLNDMTTVSDHMHLILSLHVRNSKFSVHPLGTRKEEHFLSRQGQEALCETREPLGPVLFRCQ